MSKDHVKQGGFDRRTFMHLGLGAATAIGCPSLGLRVAFGDDEKGAGAKKSSAMRLPGFGKAKHVIVLYMSGGPSHIDTWDPKPGRPTGGPFKPAKTKVDGIEIGQHLPKMASQMERFSIVRSMNSGEGSHERARYLLHTGYLPAGPVRHPDFGAVVSCECGEPGFDLPNFVSVNGATINGGGYLGVEHAPFIVNDPTKPVENLTYPKGVDRSRFARRWSLLGAIEKTFARGRSPALIGDHKNVIQRASRFMHSPRSAAFDVASEPKKSRERYGMGRFGQGVLAARRLVEVDVPYIQVNLGGWDTHRDNFKSVERLCGVLDPAFSSLLEDLDERGKLDETLVVWLGDFGRTPRINANSGRDHFPRAWSFVMAGGGIKGGRVHGATNENGDAVVKDRVRPADMFATMAHCLGIEAKKENISSAGRPFAVVDKAGKVLKPLIT